jgi:hypothetical protein
MEGRGGDEGENTRRNVSDWGRIETNLCRDVQR